MMQAPLKAVRPKGLQAFGCTCDEIEGLQRYVVTGCLRGYAGLVSGPRGMVKVKTRSRFKITVVIYKRKTSTFRISATVVCWAASAVSITALTRVINHAHLSLSCSNVSGCVSAQGRSFNYRSPVTMHSSTSQRVVQRRSSQLGIIGTRCA